MFKEINLRNHSSLHKLFYSLKIADTVMYKVSYATLYKNIKNVISTVSRNSIIDYIDYAKDAYLLFSTKNYFAKFSERESSPKYYFTDNGILNLFYLDKLPALLENLVAIKLHNKYQENLFYLKSQKTGIDIDFYVPASKIAIQVAWEVNDTSKEREVGNLIKLADNFDEVENLIIVTHGEEAEIQQKDKIIQLMPLYKFLLMR